MSCIYKDGHRCMSPIREGHLDASLPEACLDCGALTNEELEALADPDIIWCNCGNCNVGCMFYGGSICEANTGYHLWQPDDVTHVTHDRAHHEDGPMSALRSAYGRTV